MDLLLRKQQDLLLHLNLNNLMDLNNHLDLKQEVVQYIINKVKVNKPRHNPKILDDIDLLNFI